MMKPECWMIAISDNPISMYYKNFVTPSWTDRGFVVNHFEATVPATVSQHSAKIPLGKKRGRIPFTDTEIAVWYSHFSTWKLCVDLDRPIIVVEHDIFLLKDDIAPEVYEEGIACLAHVARKNGINAKLGGGAYYLTPIIAQKMVEITEERGAITYNSDWWIHMHCDKYGKWFEMHCTQIKNKSIGVTVEHNK